MGKYRKYNNLDLCRRVGVDMFVVCVGFGVLNIESSKNEREKIEREKKRDCVISNKMVLSSKHHF